MMNLEMFLLGLLIISTITSLTTEACKKILNEHNVTYQSNTLVGIVALIISAAFGVGYVIFNGMEFTTQNIIYLIMQIFMSWLCAMLGYDKVVQTISQFKTTNKGDVSE